MTARYLAFTALWLAFMAALLFAGAGDPAWPAAWAFVAEYGLLAGALVVWLARHDPALLRERFSMPIHREQARWDRVFLLAAMVVFALWFLLMGLDARRFAWSHVPVALRGVGALLFAASILVVWRVFRANTFAVPQVRAQAERAQVVIDAGPYRLVRHPMYSGSLLFVVGIPLLLGSWLGLLLAPPFALAFAARAVGEERMLRGALPGYPAYAARVRWRLIPWIW